MDFSHAFTIDDVFLFKNFFDYLIYMGSGFFLKYELREHFFHSVLGGGGGLQTENRARLPNFGS